MSSLIIAVFGSARLPVDSAGYRQAVALGRRLAEAGCAVATGGYSGVMEGVSQGAWEAGGRVIGVTADEIESFRPGGPNRFIGEEIRYETMRERLFHLIDHNDGMIALPGGIGTLAELVLAWNLIQKGSIEQRPLVVLGEIWNQLLATFARKPFVLSQERALIKQAGSPEDAVQLVLR